MLDELHAQLRPLNPALTHCGSAARSPDAPATAFQGRITTYAQLHSRSNQIAQALLADGVRSSERVAILAKNSDLRTKLCLLES